jgi:hypothetical protein
MPELSCSVPVPSSVFSALAEGADGGIAFAAYAWLWTRADTRGLAPADWSPTWLAGRDERDVLRSLASRGLVAPWSSSRHSLGAWLPDVLLSPPGDRTTAHDLDRPEVWVTRWANLARARGVTTDARPDLLAALQPRTPASVAAPTAGAPIADVRAVWDAWRARQARPQACTFGQSAQRIIRGALTETTTDGLLALIEYAYEADEAGPRYWRGQNDQRRTYLGLDNLLVRSKLASRVQLALEWSSRSSGTVLSDGHRTGDNLGPLARFR